MTIWCKQAPKLTSSELHAILRQCVTEDFRPLGALKVTLSPFPYLKWKKVLLLCYRFHKDETTFLGLTPSSPAVSDCAIILMIRLNRLLQCSFKCIQGGLNVLCAWHGSCCQSAAIGYSCGKKSFHPGCWKSKRKQKIKREVWLNYARKSS